MNLNPFTRARNENVQERFDADPTAIIRFADQAFLFACIGAIVAVYILDAIFFMAWAPEAYLIPVFMLIALVIRTVAISAGVALQWVRGMAEIRGARATVRALWVGSILLCLIPAMSFFAGGHSAQTKNAEVSQVTTEQTVQNNDEQLALIDEEIAALAEERDAALALSQQQIDLIADDGVPGISRADNEQIAGIRSDMAGIRARFGELIEEKRDEKRVILTQTEQVEVKNAEETTEVSVFYAIFDVLGKILPWSANNISIAVLFMFALFIEAMAAFGLGAYYDLHRFFVGKLRELEVEEQEHVSKVNTAAPPAEEPAADAPEKEAPQEETLPDLTAAQIRGQKGGNANAHYKKAKRAHHLRVDDHLEGDA